MLPQFSDVAFGLGSLWIVNSAGNRVVEVDPLTTQEQQQITVGKNPRAIAVGDGSLWVANFDDDTVTRIAIPGQGQTASLSTFDVGDGPVDVAFGEGAVWVVNQLDRTVIAARPGVGRRSRDDRDRQRAAARGRRRGLGLGHRARAGRGRA